MVVGAAHAEPADLDQVVGFEVVQGVAYGGPLGVTGPVACVVAIVARLKIGD
ncbi:hypothetical protein ACFV98_15945 [Streptomyces violascens]|uniref:hypothetical protein n=1 Tax=Streptomyces violascens TaxID=67381 RepID=UPI0036535AA5